ncbi:MAG: type-F conjugative transfer system protein TraW [Alphaproteobacteria bacterium]|nr:type-F conjugative transfer system protein TraW [Methylococcaceae bacterium]MDP3936117.1 type-F conjugative transfer system protein TraW [Alphaproteobacteria bacterium]
MVRVLGLVVLMLSNVDGKDFGVQGTTYPVIEESLLEHLQHQLAALPPETLQLKQLEVQDRVKQYVLTPKPVSGVHKATTVRTFTFDPSITLDKDILDHQGHIIAAKGSTVNPLTTVQLKASLLIFDGTDLEQIKWAVGQGVHTKWILTSGRPMDLIKQHDRDVYFDQGGAICKYFKISVVPSVVRQNGAVLEIEEGLGGYNAH